MEGLNESQKTALRESQRAWIKWRDAEASFSASFNTTGGASYREDYFNAQHNLIDHRIVSLNKYFKQEEIDLDDRSAESELSKSSANPTDSVEDAPNSIAIPQTLSDPSKAELGKTSISPEIPFGESAFKSVKFGDFGTSLEQNLKDSVPDGNVNYSFNATDDGNLMLIGALNGSRARIREMDEPSMKVWTEYFRELQLNSLSWNNQTVSADVLTIGEINSEHDMKPGISMGTCMIHICYSGIDEEEVRSKFLSQYPSAVAKTDKVVINSNLFRGIFIVANYEDLNVVVGDRIIRMSRTPTVSTEMKSFDKLDPKTKEFWNVLYSEMDKAKKTNQGSAEDLMKNIHNEIADLVKAKDFTKLEEHKFYGVDLPRHLYEKTSLTIVSSKFKMFHVAAIEKLITDLKVSMGNSTNRQKDAALDF